MKANKFLKQVACATFLAVFMLGLAAPAAVFADDGIPAEQPAAPAAAEAPESVTPPAESEPAGEEPAAEEALHEETSEVMQAIPDGTELVVLDENGEALPLGSLEAEQVILSGDPMWCPNDVLPGGMGCTNSATSFLGENGLLSKLTGKTGAGTVYVAWNYNSQNQEDFNQNIVFDHDSLSGLGSLTIQGGWDFATQQVDDEQPHSLFYFGTGSFSMVNWTSNITIKNIFVTETTGGSLYGGALAVVSPTNGGEVLLQDVVVTKSSGHAVVGEATERSGAYVFTAGDVTVKDSHFNGNKSVGLTTNSKGNVVLNGVQALMNEGYGVWVDNCLYDYGDGSCLTQGSVTLSGTTNIFGLSGSESQGNADTGLYIQTGGKVSADSNTVITAQSNSGNGIEIWRGDSSTSEPIELLGTNTFNENANSGLVINANGPITLHSVTANLNGIHGVNIRGLFELDPEMDEWGLAAAGLGGSLTITGVNTFNDNSNSGLEAYVDGKITASNLNANGNGYLGVLLSTCAGYYDEERGFFCYNDPAYDLEETYEFFKEDVDYDVTISGDNVFGSSMYGEGWGNEETGLMVYTYGDIKLGTASGDSVTAQNNGGFGTLLQSGIYQYTYDEEHDEWYIDWGSEEGPGVLGGGNVTLKGTHLYGGYDDEAEDYWGNYYGGLDIYAMSDAPGSGNVTMENALEASDNGGDGVFIYADGFVNVSGEAKLFDYNQGKGLVVTQSNGAKIANVTSIDNDGDGITINDAYGDVEVIDVESSGNDSEGLAIYNFYDGAKLTLTSVTANDNYYTAIWVGVGEDMGAVVVDQCEANGNHQGGMYFEYMSSLNISNSEASYNGQEVGYFGINIYIEGDVTLDTVTVNENGYNGLEIVAKNVTIKNVEASENYKNGLDIFAFGDVKVSGANKFNANGNSGLEVSVKGEGSINISNVQANANENKGLEVETYGGGRIDLTGVEASENEETGICIYTTGDVLVKNSEASSNMGDGLQIFGDDRGEPKNYTVSCSTFNSNFAGVHIINANNVYLWGVEASLNTNTDIYTGGILGGVFESESCDGGGCACKPADTVEPIGLEGVVVQVAGGENVVLECRYAWTMLQLDSQDAVKFSGMCGSQLTASLTGVSAENLPAALPDGMLMGSALTAGVNGAAIVPDGGSVRITFNVPAGLEGKALSILFWDADAGEWVKLPLFGEGGFAASDEAMRVLSGVQVNADGTITVIVNFGGTFVLVGE